MKRAFIKGIIVIIGIILQIWFTLSLTMNIAENITAVNYAFLIMSVLIILNIIKNSMSLSKDLPWIIIILLFPLAGTIMYLFIGRNWHRSKVVKSLSKNIESSKKYLKQDESITRDINENHKDKLKYISEYAGFPVTKNNKVDYYELGDKVYPVMLEELKKAKKFVFLEYFLISKGKMWNNILEILKEKAKEGVDVRVIYDDMGCFASLPNNYPLSLEKMGIKCVCFNKMKPFAGVIMNNRDHRKIMVVDGKVAISGGINIADEYINEDNRLGHWKDNGIRVKGDAVWNFTVMFLQAWNSFRNDDDDYYKFKFDSKREYAEDGYVVAYGESPLDNEVVGENVYLNIMNQAKKYLYIFTPYLIIDTDMINSLKLAAKRGVDVRICVPGIPDKKIVYSLTNSYFEQLIKGGVKIYKYTPGFVHSKVFVADDNVATVGTLNMDYRSLYLHFENGIFLQDNSTIKDISKDLKETIEKSQEVTLEEAKPKNFMVSLYYSLLRVFAPLM